MNFIDKWIAKKVEKQLAIQQKAAPFYQPGIRYQINNGRIVAPQDNVTTFIRDGYSVNDIVYSIITMILDKVRLPEWSLYKVVDESSLKVLRALMQRKNLSGKERNMILRLKDQSLEPIKNPNLQQGKLLELLKYPNDYCDWQSLIADTAMFNLITGNAYWFGDPLKNGANQGIPNEINVLPSQYMTIKVGDDFPPRPVGYEIFMWNQSFTAEQIMHQKRENPNWDFNGSQLYGMSPLKAALKNLTRNNSAKDASTAKFQNGGLEEIIYMDDQRFTAGEGKAQIQALKQQLAEEYGGPNNQGKFAISGYKVDKVGLGLSPVELAIIDSEKWDAVMFCNIYGVPPELLGLVQKTYNNVKEAEKALTSRSALPLLNAISKSFNRKLQQDWGGNVFKNIYVDYDLECFTELQVDIAEVVNTTSKMIMITPNEEREAVGWESRPEPEADEPWVLNGGNRVPLSDYQANQVDAQLMQDALQNGTNTNNAQQNGSAGNSANRVGQARMSNGNGKNIQFAKTV